AGLARLLGRELVRGALFVGRLATSAAGLARLLGRELVRGALFVGRLATFARDIALLLLIHAGETTLTIVTLVFLGHENTPFRVPMVYPCAKFPGRGSMHAPSHRNL